MTPLDELASLPGAANFLRPGVTLLELQHLARALTDVQAVEKLDDARQTLFSGQPHAQTNKAGRAHTGRALEMWTMADAHRHDPWTT